MRPLTPEQLLEIYRDAYKTAGAPPAQHVAAPSYLAKVRAFFSRNPTKVINAAGDRANPGVGPVGRGPQTNMNLRNQLLAKR